MCSRQSTTRYEVFYFFKISRLNASDVENPFSFSLSTAFIASASSIIRKFTPYVLYVFLLYLCFTSLLVCVLRFGFFCCSIRSSPFCNYIIVHTLKYVNFFFKKYCTKSYNIFCAIFLITI